MVLSLQNLTASLMAIISSAALLLIIKFPGRITFLIIILIWAIFLFLGEWQLRRIKRIKQSILPILFFTIFSFVSLVSVVEWKFLNWPFILLLGMSVFLLFQSIVEDNKSLLQIEQKPYRRIMVLIWSFDVYALITTVFALSLFFPRISFWMLTIAGGVIFGIASFMIWKMYFQLNLRRSLVWVFLISFLMIEFVWVMHLLPFGYFVLGFFTTWLWYILQLLLRFHFGPRGVIWKRQIWFLAGNLALFVLMMVFFVRWV